MASGKLDTSITEPAIGGLRFAFLCMLLLLGACASQPKPKEAPKPAPLKDKSADTDYRLGEVELKLKAAAEFEQDGQRVIASSVIDTAAGMLPDDFTRERQYLDVVKAGIWARDGEGREPAKASELLAAVISAAQKANDRRLLADAYVGRVLVELGEGDTLKAKQTGEAALKEFEAVEAHVQAVWTARNLAYQFLDAERAPAAKAFAERAIQITMRLDDDELLVQVGTDVARVFLAAGDNAEPYFEKAYEAAYRLRDSGWGWRNVVIAAAVDAYFINDDKEACIRWGNRLRDRDRGLMPSLRDSGLWAEDYITVLAQYAFASDEVSPKNARAIESAELAVKAIDSLDEAEQPDWKELKEKLVSGLLQPPRKK
ncbi:MAG: hypothetical protein KDB32_01250 [Planctomycetes bacterium]|nr:hypothetical protein [Planctomycetota bacterium]